jgi:SpoVK/Ycf46/Vps4 family AAA+-type ATPase
MRQALNHVEAMAPCVLLIDEVDKALGGSSGTGDSGTTSRVCGTLLTWLQERNNDQSPIFIIMTANNIVGLPPELMRRGRLDEIFAVNFPNHTERQEILKIHVERRGHKLTAEDYYNVASCTKDFVGAELEAIVKDSITLCFYNKEKKLKGEHLIEEAKNIIPLSRAFADKVKAMNDWAKNNAKPASALGTETVVLPKKDGVIRRGKSSSLRKRTVNRNITDN